MGKEEFMKLWRHWLIDAGVTEGQVAEEATSASKAALNQKINNVSIRFVDFENILEHYGYEFKIVKKEGGK